MLSTTTTSITSNTTSVTISQCVGMCPPGTLSVGSPAACSPCDPKCKECMTTNTTCTKCNDITLAPDSTGNCVNKSTITITSCNPGSYPITMQNGTILNCLPCDPACGTCLGGSSQDCLTCNANDPNLFVVNTLGTTKVCGSMC